MGDLADTFSMAPAEPTGIAALYLEWKEQRKKGEPEIAEDMVDFMAEEPVELASEAVQKLLVVRSRLRGLTPDWFLIDDVIGFLRRSGET